MESMCFQWSLHLIQQVTRSIFFNVKKNRKILNFRAKFWSQSNPWISSNLENWCKVRSNYSQQCLSWHAPCMWNHRLLSKWRLSPAKYILIFRLFLQNNLMIFYLDCDIPNTNISEDVCNHLRSFLLYQASLRNTKGFPAIRCDSYEDFLVNGMNGKCNLTEIVYMGLHIDRK